MKLNLLLLPLILIGGCSQFHRNIASVDTDKKLCASFYRYNHVKKTLRTLQSNIKATMERSYGHQGKIDMEVAYIQNPHATATTVDLKLSDLTNLKKFALFDIENGVYLPYQIKKGFVRIKLNPHENIRLQVTDKLPSNKVFIGIDLGGTKIAMAAVSETPLRGEAKLLFKKEVPTFAHGEGPLTLASERETFLKRLANEIKDVMKQAQSQGYDVQLTVGFGSPGLLKNGVITPETSQQLGKAFNGYNIEKGLEKYLKSFHSNIEVKVNNDALAQLAFGIHGLYANPATKKIIANQKVGFIGPGTSLGGGFSQVKVLANGKIDPVYFTDGHIFDVLIDGKLAHDLISGRYFEQTLGISGKQVASDLEKYRSYVEEMGTNMGKLIQKIHNGKFEKPAANTPWSGADFKAVKGTSIYILGGSIATKGEMGKIVQASALKYLQEQGLSDIRLLTLPSESANAGVLGAASFGGLKNLNP